MFSIVLIQIAQKLLRDHVGLSDLPSLCAVSCKQMLVRRLKQKAVQQGRRPALIVVLPAVIAFYCRMQLCFEFPRRSDETASAGMSPEPWDRRRPNYNRPDFAAVFPPAAPSPAGRPRPGAYPDV